MAVKTETFGSGDTTWLGSDHGMFNARTGTIKVSTFTKATHYPDGYFRSGTAVNVASETAVKPWTGASGEKLGYVLFDRPTDGATDFGCAIVRHGTVKTARLPIAHIAPTAGADASQFSFVTEAGA